MSANFRKLLLIILFAAFLHACGSAPRFTSRSGKVQTDETNPPKENLDEYKNYPPLETVYGTASFYADKYHGKITFNGEVYDMNGISAAHPSYKMNTIVRITNLANNKSVIVRINDRMPFREDRIIDLSLGTAKELDFVKQGLADIKLEVLKWGG